MSSFSVNSIIEWIDTPKSRYDRVLRINFARAIVILIDVTNINDDDAVNPVVQPYDLIEEALRTSKARIANKDPYLEELRPKVIISDRDRIHQEKVWEVIESIISHDDIFNPKVRSKLISSAATRAGLSPKIILRYLRRYWRGGQTQQALLPRYHRCGTGRIQKEDEQKNKKAYKKLGRKSKKAKAGAAEGVNLDPVAEEHFLCGIKLFYENGEGRSLRYAYQKTMETFFLIGKYSTNDVNNVPLLPSDEDIPSYRQFHYFYYKKYRNIVTTTIARESQRSFNLKHRALPGNSTSDAKGPGYVVQLDSTIGDVYLVSEFDRTRIIGRPVIYIIIDVFSHLIIGLSVRLDGPSWYGAMQALENMVRDKVSFCREYNYTIAEADWPSHHLPKGICADRGELLSKNSDVLTKDFGIRVINTPPYRPDWKAIVERNFRVLNDEIIHWVPGAVCEYPKRGEPDYRLDSCLTLYELRRLLIGCVIEHNTCHKITNYPRDKDMIGDGVQPFPAQLWNWGVHNRSGGLNERPPENVSIKLLPQAKASVTGQGIYFNKLHYECNLAWQEQWFVQARIAGRWSIPIAYDPQTTNRIYLRLDEGRQIEECKLMPKDQRLAGFDWQDIEDRRIFDAIAGEEQENQARQRQVEIHTQQEEIICDAQAKTEAVRKGFSKAELIRNISSNRAEEIKYELQKELQSSQIASSSSLSPALANQEELPEDGFKVRQVQWLRKMRNGETNHE